MLSLGINYFMGDLIVTSIIVRNAQSCDMRHIL